MSRYYALVLVPSESPAEEACDAALELLYPYMHTDGEPDKDARFDYLLGPEQLVDLGDDDNVRNIWPVDIVEYPAN